MIRRALAVGAVLLAWAAPALSTPPALAERTDAWLEATLGVAIPDRPVFEITGAAAQECECRAQAWDDRLEFTPSVWNGLASLDHEPVDYSADGQALLHETLHTADGMTITNPALEEGVVDALALDLYPAWGKAMGVYVWPTAPNYPAEVRLVRTASARATGTPWRSRAARLWRRDLWRADQSTRTALVVAAFTKGTR